MASPMLIAAEQAWLDALARKRPVPPLTGRALIQIVEALEKAGDDTSPDPARVATYLQFRALAARAVKTAEQAFDAAGGVKP